MRGICQRLFRFASIASCFFLAACGGGGGGGTADDPFGDGLGISGQAAGTVSMGPASLTTGGDVAPLVTLDDIGRALAIWLDATYSNHSVITSRDSGSGWETPSVISAAQSVNVKTLRTAADGTSVMGWSYPARMLRYHPVTGWDSTATDIPASFSQPPLDKDSDLDVLTDGAVVLSRRGSASVPSGSKTTSSRIFKHTVSTGWTTLLETPPENNGYSYLAANPDGSAILFRMESETQVSGIWKYGLRLQSVDLNSGSSLAPLSFAANAYTSCYSASPIKGVNSPTRWKVLSVMHQESGGTGCSLDLFRIDITLISTFSQRMTPPGSYLAGPPILAMNDAGDAIAIWAELPSFSGRVMWSQSLQGGPWSTPELLITDPSLGQAVAGFYSVSFAMNPGGQGVVGLMTIHNNRQYLVVGRFSFSTGWSNWRKVADINTATPPAVAIDPAGNGLLVYGGEPCDRDPAGYFTNCRPDEMFALRF